MRFAERLGWATTVAALTFACRAPRPPVDEQSRYVDDEQRVWVEEETEPPGRDEPRPPPIADRPGARRGPLGVPPPSQPALHPDEGWSGDEPVITHRYVYQVRLTTPTYLGTGGERVTLPAAELFMDVAHERLRARFVGRGWPVSSGSEVRLRRDRPGVYVFDGRGGRSLEPGRMAEWFDGGRVTRRGPALRVFGSYGFGRHEPIADDQVVPGRLVCALLGEWAGEDREGVMRRCERGAPRLWRLGFWQAEQTAGVPISRVRSSLRADEQEPPPPIQHEDSHAFLDPSALARIPPEAPLRGGSSGVEGALRVTNETQNRVILTVEGVPVGWVGAGAEARMEGLRPGTYEIGSVRPLGAIVQRGRAVRVPGAHRICDGRCGESPVERTGRGPP